MSRRLPGDIALGPDHPTLDGLPSISLDVADGVVISAEWIPGTVHRGAEKLFESRDYRQILMLVDRHDWLSAFCSEIGVVVGVERALGLTPPERAQHLRILLCELTRIAHHLAFLAPLPGSLPDSWRARAWGWRAEILDLIEAATGHRVHPMFCQVGGVRADVSAEWVARVSRAADSWTAPHPAGALAAIDGPELGARAQCRRTPESRSSPPGRPWASGHLGPSPGPAGSTSTCDAMTPTCPTPRSRCPRAPMVMPGPASGMLVDELAPSIGLVAWAAEQLAGSTGAPVDVRLPKVVRVPEGSTYTWTENPPGINGYLLVSRNDRTPWRLKLRSAGFGNAAAMGAALEGTAVTDLPAAIASFLIVCGDVDR